MKMAFSTPPLPPLPPSSLGGAVVTADLLTTFASPSVVAIAMVLLAGATERLGNGSKLVSPNDRLREPLKVLVAVGKAEACAIRASGESSHPV